MKGWIHYDSLQKRDDSGIYILLTFHFVQKKKKEKKEKRERI